MKLDDIVQFEGGNVGVVYYYNKFEVNRKKINRVEVKGQNHIVRVDILPRLKHVGFLSPR